MGTPTRAELRSMNPNYTEFKFPQIKGHSWNKQILINYLQYVMDGHSSGTSQDREFISSPPPSDMERVAKLMKEFLAEIASERNLFVSKFVSLAELIPELARISEDGMYRAIDIYLKAHPALSDTERKKVCSVMDWKKLTREACAHAAQNERLHVHCVVQVLYFEHHRLREVVESSLVSGDEVPSLLLIVRQQHSASLDAVTEELPSLKKRTKICCRDTN